MDMIANPVQHVWWATKTRYPPDIKSVYHTGIDTAIPLFRKSLYYVFRLSYRRGACHLSSPCHFFALRNLTIRRASHYNELVITTYLSL
jgi:hypothetical protein